MGTRADPPLPASAMAAAHQCHGTAHSPCPTTPPPPPPRTVTEMPTPRSCACVVCMRVIWPRSRTSCCARMRVPAVLPCLAVALMSCRGRCRCKQRGRYSPGLLQAPHQAERRCCCAPPARPATTTAGTPPQHHPPAFSSDHCAWRRCLQEGVPMTPPHPPSLPAHLDQLLLLPPERRDLPLHVTHVAPQVSLRGARHLAGRGLLFEQPLNKQGGAKVGVCCGGWRLGSRRRWRQRQRRRRVVQRRRSRSACQGGRSAGILKLPPLCKFTTRAPSPLTSPRQTFP